ncbi:Tnni3k [Symbiodinium natans]|uniref:Tnni3k protein n=1 Tax=Symbiodinium natans TaxID=878477 RepID=A0A812IA22_9DINO|nr:Tnni3k [Symbiodinium natans]
MLQASLQCRIAFLEAKKTHPALCRYLKGRFHDWADAEPSHTQRSEEDFLSHFGFPSLAEGLKVRDIGALACAVLSDNIPMIQRLVQAKACMRTRCKPLMNVDVLAWTPLHLAVQRGSRALPVMAELLRLKADPNSTDTLGLPLLGISRDAATVEFLVQHHADVNFQAGVSKVSPLGLSAARVSSASVISKLLELRADVNGSEARGGLGHSALVNLIWESRTLQQGGVQLAALLVRARADVNASGRATGPLGYAALGGHAPMVSLLLASRADPDLPNSRGMTPRQLADAQTQLLFECMDCMECSPEGLTDSNMQPLFCEDNANDWDEQRCFSI